MGTLTETGNATLVQQVRRRRRAVRRAVLYWAPGAARRYPWRQPGRSPYEILIAEVLLKRTTSTAANRIYEDFLHLFPSFESVAAAPEAALEAVLSTVGLQRQRAKALRDIARHVLEHWGGVLPEDVEELQNIPHIGPYAASAVMSFAFDRPAAIVDSNVERIIKRLFRDSLPDRLTPALVQRVADLMLPSRKHREFNLGLLDLGALVCRYVQPRCDLCPLIGSCDFGQSARRASRATAEAATGPGDGSTN